MSILPKDTLIDISLTVRLPADATKEQIEQWLNYNICQRGGISLKNPLYTHECEAWASHGLDWRDTGYIGREEKYDIKKSELGEVQYKVRYSRYRRENAA